ncbi:MAG TPA: four helix bundle protein [Candidatus Pacearchaeota archaeon]|jgi:four helix bundle protein|nr:four helix bundle protein [Candidatus Pacearchaeota archaeon]
MTNQIQNPNVKNKYNLEERTAVFGESIIGFAKTLPKDAIVFPLISQLVRSSTSVGANYMEADCAESKKDFRHKIGICKKEAKETTHWLRMMAKATPDKKNECREFWREAHQLVLIFSAILRK